MVDNIMYYSISEFAEKIGVSTYTLRLWEKNGKLIPHHRTRGNQRVYSDEQVQEYLGIVHTKEVVLTFVGDLLHKEPITDLTNEELDQVIKIARQIKAERNK